jgi:hypothetical protein
MTGLLPYILTGFTSAALALMGGHPASLSTHPSVVQIEALQCSAVLISPTRILTAAHCFFPGMETGQGLYSSRPVSLGTEHTRLALLRNDGSRIRRIEAVLRNVQLHPSYEPAVRAYLRELRVNPQAHELLDSAIDLAVLVVDELNLPPTPLAQEPARIGQELEMAGYGCSRFEDLLAARLGDGAPPRSGSVPPNSTLRVGAVALSQATGAHYFLDARQHPRTVVCPGDSGGALLHRGQLVGVLIQAAFPTEVQTEFDFQTAAQNGLVSSVAVRLDDAQLQEWILQVPDRPRGRFETIRIR